LDKLDMAAINDNGVFVPVAPLMLPPADVDAGKGAMLSLSDERSLLAEQVRACACVCAEH
jgi:hypothetical protein